MVTCFTKIKRIIKKNKSRKMVDISVEDNGNFVLANGVCVCNSAMIDLNVLRLTDVLLLKEPSLLQTEFERPALQKRYAKITPLFKKQKEKAKCFYVWSDDFEGMLSYELPGFWNDSISKSFKNFNQ